MRLDEQGRRWVAVAVVAVLAALAGREVHGQFPPPAPAGPQRPRDPGVVPQRPSDGLDRGRDTSSVDKGRERGIQPGGDTGRKARRGASRSLERARRGIGRFDSTMHVVPGCSPNDFYFKGSSS